MIRKHVVLAHTRGLDRSRFEEERDFFYEDRVRTFKRRFNESYTSFTRWRNDIVREPHRWTWHVAKKGTDFPDPVWADDLYVEVHDYIICVSLAPDGDTMSFNVFKGYDFPYDRPVHIKCSKSELHERVDEIQGKVPDEIYRELKAVFSSHRFA